MSRRRLPAPRSAPRGSARPGPSAPPPPSATPSTTPWRLSAPRCCSSPTRPSAFSPPLKIVDARERTVPIGAPMRNAAIAFDTMSASAVALATDAGLTGFAFDSIGRYGKGALLRERFFPRLLGAPSEALLDAEGFVDPPALARV